MKNGGRNTCPYGFEKNTFDKLRGLLLFLQQARFVVYSPSVNSITMCDPFGEGEKLMCLTEAVLLYVSSNNRQLAESTE